MYTVHWSRGLGSIFPRMSYCQRWWRWLPKSQVPCPRQCALLDEPKSRPCFQNFDGTSSNIAAAVLPQVGFAVAGQLFESSVDRQGSTCLDVNTETK